MTTFYDDLEISADASADDVRRAYRRLALLHHPDKNGNSAESTQRFQQVTAAYETLSDADRRQQYDRQLMDSDGVRTEDIRPDVDVDQIFQQVFSQVFGSGLGANFAHIRFNVSGGPMLFHQQFIHVPQPVNPDIVETVAVSFMDVFLKKRKKMTVQRRLLNGQKEPMEVRFTCNQTVQMFEGQGNQYSPTNFGKIQVNLTINHIPDEYRIIDTIHLYRKIHVPLEQFYKGWIMYKHLDDRNYQFNFNMEELRQQEIKLVGATGLGLEIDGQQGDLRLEICVDV